jgi:hypothetical protein
MPARPERSEVKETAMIDDFSESLSKTFYRICLSFAVPFFLLYLLYTLVDSLRNPGQTISGGFTYSDWKGNIAWAHMFIDPTVIALGFSALIMGFKTGRRKAVYSGLMVFVANYLIFRLSFWFYTQDRMVTLGSYVSCFSIVFYAIIVGVITGAMIGYFQDGWKKIGWYAKAGALGFTVGFFIKMFMEGSILYLSPLGRLLGQLVIGTHQYYLFFLVPALLEGLAIGISMGLAVIILKRQAIQNWETQPL